MPVKHQGDSYRNRRGERYTCWTDELSADHRHSAKIVVQELRKKNVRAFAEHNNDEGYSRVFIHEKEAFAAGVLVNNPA